MLLGRDRELRQEKDKGNHSNLSEGLNENNDRFVVKVGMPTTFALVFNRL